MKKTRKNVILTRVKMKGSVVFWYSLAAINIEMRGRGCGTLINNNVVNMAAMNIDVNAKVHQYYM